MRTHFFQLKIKFPECLLCLTVNGLGLHDALISVSLRNITDIGRSAGDRNIYFPVAHFAAGLTAAAILFMAPCTIFPMLTRPPEILIFIACSRCAFMSLVSIPL